MRLSLTSMGKAAGADLCEVPQDWYVSSAGHALESHGAGSVHQTNFWPQSVVLQPLPTPSCMPLQHAKQIASCSFRMHGSVADADACMSTHLGQEHTQQTTVLRPALPVYDAAQMRENSWWQSGLQGHLCLIMLVSITFCNLQHGHKRQPTEAEDSGDSADSCEL